MSDSTTRVKPTFSNLPEALKKRIVRFLKELDEEEQQGEDDCGSCCGGGEGDHDHEHEHENGHGHEHKQLKQLEKAVEDLELGGGASNVSNLSLINKEWHKACCSYIWQSPDLAERSLESLFHFQKNLLPKYSEYVDSLFLIQNGSNFLEEEEESPYKMVDGTSEEEREEKLVEQVETVAGVEKPKDESIRQLRARSLVLGEIVKACPNLVKIEFDCPEIDDEEEEEEESMTTELRDYVVDALKQHANAFKSLSHIGYSLTPVSTSSYEDAASLLSTYSTQLRSLRLDCVSAPGDSDSIFNALLSLEKLESLDLADSDLAFDYSQLDVKWPLRRLVLGEFLDLSTEAFSTLVNKFSSTLEILNLDGAPSYEEEGEGDEQKVVKEFKQYPIKNLPKLEILEISTNHSTKVLEWLTSSSPTAPLRELRVGFCPNFNVDQVIAFVEKNQSRIKYFELDVSCFNGVEQVSKLGAVCEELGIKFQLVSVGYEDDDFLGGGFGGEDEEEEEEDAEWEDEE
ncbi:hypothetical protein JCM5350_001827 [Sporobolomyces pararoseus]